MSALAFERCPKLRRLKGLQDDVNEQECHDFNKGSWTTLMVRENRPRAKTRDEVSKCHLEA